MKSAAVRLMLLGVRRLRACGRRSSSFLGERDVDEGGVVEDADGEGERVARRVLEDCFLLLGRWR